MKKKVTKKIKNSISDISADANNEQSDNKTLEIIKSWGYGIFWLVVVL